MNCKKDKNTKQLSIIKQTKKGVINIDPASRISVSNLTPEQIKKITDAAQSQILIEEAKEIYEIGSIDYIKERETFLIQCSRNNSKHTRRSYDNALKKLENYCDEISKPVLFMKSKDADDFITNLKTNKKSFSAVSINTITNSCSSFFTFISRRYPAINNPFFGTKMKPRNKNKKPLEIPTKKEIDLIIKNISNRSVKAAIFLLAESGLRVGALETLKISGTKYHCYTKGKDARGELNNKVLSTLKKYKLSTPEPFIDKKHTVIADTFRRVTKRLHKQKLIKAAYSVHDLRHYYAVDLYKRTLDIHLVKERLNHSGIAITDRYLRDLENAGR